MRREYVLAIDVGTGSVRVAVVSLTGEIVSMVQYEHDQRSPHHGWAEQNPYHWWAHALAGMIETVKQAPEIGDRLACISVCGQMHGTVLVDEDGSPVLDWAPLWNDKRCDAEVKAFVAANDIAALLPRTANPPTVAWPAFKLQWIRAHCPEAWKRTVAVLMPKDYITCCLTGGLFATDFSEASCFYTMDAQTRRYDEDLLARLDLPASLMPPLHAAWGVIGGLSPKVARQTGLPQGLPVVAGTSDMAASLLGSGVYAPGVASDSTGTSTLLTVVSQKPRPSLSINALHLANEAWGMFSILDAGGDAMRWARLAFHENTLSYQNIADKAEQAPPGCRGLFFLPYLTGERNAAKTNSRAQFFGLTRQHRLGDLHRAVLEGVAFGAGKCLDELRATGASVERLIASGGGAKSDLWLSIKAAVYGVPILRTAQSENGLVGCAMVGGLGVGAFTSAKEATEACVRFDKEFSPDPALCDRYARMREIFDDLYVMAQGVYDRLDALPA